MVAYTTNQYKNEKRRQAKSFIREGMFVSDYVHTKYNAVYQEAAELYNQINRIHPRKPDLRRTTEYRQWKNNMSAQQNKPIVQIPRQKNRVYVHITHRDIPIPSAADPNIITDLPTIESPRTTRQTSSQPPSESPRAVRQKIMQLKIPLTPSPNTPKPIQDPQKIVETVIDEGNEMLSPSILDTTYTETVIDEGNQMLSPSILDELSPEIIDKIIDDLRQDPGLGEIMTNIENQTNVEEEIVGLDVDIPDIDDLLEEELQNIIW